MARNALVDAGFLVALLSRRDSHHSWAVTQAPGHGPPWRTCEAVLSEAFHLLGARGAPGLSALLRRRALIAAFDLDNDVESVLKLLQKYADVPMSLADACLVRMPPKRIWVLPLINTGRPAVSGFIFSIIRSSRGRTL